MNLLKEIWPYVEDIGVPILAIITVLSCLSINFYLRTCSNLRELEKYIEREYTTRGFKKNSLPFIGLFDILYSFKPISKFNKEHLKHIAFRDLLNSVIAFRKFYRIIFPIVILLAIIGISINECIIDK